MSLVNRHHPKILGDYKLQTEKNNGKVVYRKDLTYESSSIYLYSLDTSKLANHDLNARITYELVYLYNAWMVRFHLNYHDKTHLILDIILIRNSCYYDQ